MARDRCRAAAERRSRSPLPEQSPAQSHRMDRSGTGRPAWLRRWEMEGLALSVFLERIAREHGWQLRYADAALASEASGIVLHGSVNGLPPREALAVAITTSGLSHRLENGELDVFRGSGVKKPL